MSGYSHSQQQDASLLIARGLDDGIIAINKFGRNPDVDAGTEDIWSQGGTWVQPTAARVHAIVSTDTNDSSAGTGARTITVNGLNGSYVDTTETITMNGTTPVNTVNSYWIIHRMIVATGGGTATATGTNIGTITATAAVDATVSAAIVIGKGQTQLCIYQIPAGYTAYLERYVASFNGGLNANVEVELYVKPFGGTFNLKGTLVLDQAGASFAERNYYTPLKFTAKSIIKLRATSDSANSNVVGSFDLILIED